MKRMRFGVKKRVKCVRCGMAHRTDRCRSKGKKALRLYGSVDQEGRYVAPQGVNVRIQVIPSSWDSERLRRAWRELG